MASKFTWQESPGVWTGQFRFSDVPGQFRIGSRMVQVAHVQYDLGHSNWWVDVNLPGMGGRRGVQDAEAGKQLAQQILDSWMADVCYEEGRK